MTILCIDPGRDKCGWALVGARGDLQCCGFVSRSQLPSFAVSLFAGTSPDDLTWGCWPGEKPTVLLIGDGTTSGSLVGELKAAGLDPQLVDERGTTEEAYRLYELLFPPKGIKRLIPAGIRRPSRPIDDLAAWAIAGRYLKEKAHG